jgi:hypothetical protein
MRIANLFMRLLAFSMVATAMYVTLRPPERARELFYGGHSYVCDFEAN